MNDIILKVNEAVKNYYNKYERYPNTILINENDLNLLKHNSSPFLVDDKTLREKNIYEICGLIVIPIKYGEIQVVEVLL